MLLSHLILQQSAVADQFIKDVFADLGIDCRQRIIKQVQVGIAVRCSG